MDCQNILANIHKNQRRRDLYKLHLHRMATERMDSLALAELLVVLHDIQ